LALGSAQPITAHVAPVTAFFKFDYFINIKFILLLIFIQIIPHRRKCASRYTQPVCGSATSNGVQETNILQGRQSRFGYPFCKIKREATPPHKTLRKIASHFILP